MYMNLLELTKIIKTEKKAFKYLCKQKDRLNHKILCPFCKSDEYYLMDRISQFNNWYGIHHWQYQRYYTY